jgi:hypothetical protein
MTIEEIFPASDPIAPKRITRQIAGKRDYREVPSNLAGSAMTGPP